MFQKQPPEVFYKKSVLRYFAKFTAKHLCQSLFFNKVCRPQPCNFIEKETLAQVFSCKFCEISKNTFFTEHLWTTASYVFHLKHQPSQHFNVGSTLFQRWDQRWNNVDPTLKMKQNPTSDFQRCTTLIQRRCPTSKQRWYNFISTLFQRVLNFSKSYIKTNEWG